MNKNSLLVWHCAVLGLMLVYTSSFANTSKDKTKAVEPKEISWAFDPWSPLHEMKGTGKDAKAEGLLIEILSEILEKNLGYKIIFRQSPWKRCQENVKKGVEDFMVTTPTEKRLTYTKASKMPLIVLKSKMYVKPENFEKYKKVDTIEKIFRQNMVLAKEFGSGWFEENIKNRTVDGKKLSFYEVKSYAEVAEFIHLGRADATLQDEITFDHTLQKHKINLKKSEHSFKDVRLHFLLSHKSKFSQDLVDQVNELFTRLEADGTLAKITSRYIK